MNKSRAAHFLTFSADQGRAQAQFCYGILLDSGDGIPMTK
jgi:TPR repeat protein